MKERKKVFKKQCFELK